MTRACPPPSTTAPPTICPAPRSPPSSCPRRSADPLLSDHELVLARAMGLPTFETSGLRLFKRLTFVAARGRIGKVFYPVFPPDRNAGDALAWLESLQSASPA
jgi:hypothetical protein